MTSHRAARCVALLWVLAGCKSAIGQIDAGVNAGPDRDAALHDAGSGDPPPVVGAAGDACETEDARACSGRGSRLPLVCNGGSWQPAEPCTDDERCDAASGAHEGTCRPVLAECEGQAPGKPFCTGMALRVCADLVVLEELPCASGESCAEADGLARCDADECGDDHGGCDALTQCVNTVEALECGACPAGYAGEGASGCVPVLLNLEVEGGELDPAFDANQSAYTVSMPFANALLELTPEAAMDAEIQIDGDLVESGTAWSSPRRLGSTSIELEVAHGDRETRQYVLNVARGELEAHFKAGHDRSNSTTIGGQLFGQSVAIDGDTLVVGAPGEDLGYAGIDPALPEHNLDYANRSGAVFVFVRGEDGWEQQAHFKASNPGAGDRFGTAVAISGNTIVVSAPAEDSSGEGPLAAQDDDTGTDSGAVYVFVRDDVTWSEQAYLKPGENVPGGFFGVDVDLEADRLVIGSSAADKVYVFERADGVWSEEPAIAVAGYPIGVASGFGCSVALSGNTLVAGARLDRTSVRGVDGDLAAGPPYAPNSGAAFVFVREAGGAWTQQAYLKASNTDRDDAFGSSVAIADDLIVVGASLEDSAATGIDGDQESDASTDSGAVYVFERSAGSWTQTAYVKPGTVVNSQAFGSDVALLGDRIAVGAVGDSIPGADLGGDATLPNRPDSGSVYVFDRAGAGWNEAGRIQAVRPTLSRYFGQSVALAEDAIAIGTPHEQGTGTGVNPDSDETTNSSASRTNYGSVYLYR